MGNTRVAAGLLLGSLLLAGCGSTVTGQATSAPGASIPQIPISSSADVPSSATIPTSDPGGGGGGGTSSGSCGLTVSDVEQALGVNGVTNSSPGGGGSNTFKTCLFTGGGGTVLAVSAVRIPSGGAGSAAARGFVQGATRSEQSQPISGLGDAAAYLPNSQRLHGSGVAAAKDVNGTVLGVIIGVGKADPSLKNALITLARKAVNAG